MKPNSDVMDRIVYDLTSSIDTPRALSVWLCYKYSQLELLQLPATDFAHNTTEEVKLDYFITSYLSKYKDLKTGLDLDAVALEKWYTSEDLCKKTNVAFRQFTHRGFPREFPRVEAQLDAARRKIAQILGGCHFRSLFEECKWSSGSTYDIPLRDASPDQKMLRTISVTDEALPLLRAVLESDPHWMEAITGVHPDGPFCTTRWMYRSVKGCKYVAVPKSAKTHRSIASEPTGNAFLQQGIHSYMVRRLKRFGVDLTNQIRNQSAAESAYSDGLATLDARAASDSISRELVYFLLPIKWALLLDTVRSKQIRVNNTWIRTEKFVSMGNAFCFELETLIFYALARAVCGEDSKVEVYGDDIIVPSEYSEELIALLELCGFQMNIDKTYTKGNFYESCGEHFHRGHRITPAYQKEPLQAPSELVRAHNRLIRFGLTLPDDHRLWRKIQKISKWMISNHPGRERPLVPYGVESDDGYLVHPFKLLKAYDKNHGFRCRVLVYVPRWTGVRSECALLAYKFRRFSYQNSRSTGHCGSEAPGRWVYKTRWIPESDTLIP